MAATLAERERHLLVAISALLTLLLLDVLRVWLPSVMKKLSLATPHAWSLEAFDAVLTRSTVDHLLVLDCCAMLLAFAAAFFACGWWRFRSAD